MGVFVRDVVLKIGAVRDVAIDKQVRPPFVPKLEPGTRFGGVGLHVIAVEIEVGRVRSKTHFVGPVLVDAHEGIEIFMPIDVVDGHENDDDVLEQIEPCFGDSNIAEQREPRVLTVNLAGVNAGLDKDDGFPLTTGQFGRKGQPGCRHQQRHVAPLAALADRTIPNKRRRCSELLSIGNCLVVTRCFLVVGTFCRCLPGGRDVGRLALRKCVYDRGENQDEEACELSFLHNLLCDALCGLRGFV